MLKSDSYENTSKRNEMVGGFSKTPAISII